MRIILIVYRVVYIEIVCYETHGVFSYVVLVIYDFLNERVWCGVV